MESSFACCCSSRGRDVPAKSVRTVCLGASDMAMSTDDRGLEVIATAGTVGNIVEGDI